MDTNVFRTASDRYYRFSFCPGFWDLILFAAEQKIVCSIDRVRDEFRSHDDDEEHDGDSVNHWVRQKLPKSFFHSTNNDEVAGCYGQLVNWAKNRPDIKQTAWNGFYNTADVWLIAYAQVNQLILVTEEASAPGSKKSIKIPDASKEFGVRCFNTFEMLDSLKRQLILKTP